MMFGNSTIEVAANITTETEAISLRQETKSVY